MDLGTCQVCLRACVYNLITLYIIIRLKTRDSRTVSIHGELQEGLESLVGWLVSLVYRGSVPRFILTHTYAYSLVRCELHGRSVGR